MLKRLLFFLLLAPLFTLAQQNTVPSGAAATSATTWFKSGTGATSRLSAYNGGWYYPFLTVQDTAHLSLTFNNGLTRTANTVKQGGTYTTISLTGTGGYINGVTKGTSPITSNFIGIDTGAIGITHAYNLALSGAPFTSLTASRKGTFMGYAKPLNGDSVVFAIDSSKALFTNTKTHGGILYKFPNSVAYTDSTLITQKFFNTQKGTVLKAYIDSLNSAVFTGNHTYSGASTHTGSDIYNNSGSLTYNVTPTFTNGINMSGSGSRINTDANINFSDISGGPSIYDARNGGGTFSIRSTGLTSGINIASNQLSDYNGINYLKASGIGAGALKDSVLSLPKNGYDILSPATFRTNLDVYSKAQSDANYVQNQNVSPQTANFFINGIGTIGDGVTTVRSTNYKFGFIKAVNPSDGLNEHIFVTNANFTKTTSGLALADYDGFDTMGDNTAAINYDHHVVYQARTRVDIGNTNTLTNLYGGFTTPSILSGIVTNGYGLYIKGPTVTAGASLVNNTGLFIQGLTTGSGKVRAILTGNNISTLGDVESSNTLATGSAFRFVAGSTYVSEGGMYMDGVANTVSNIHFKVRTSSAVVDPTDGGTSEVFGIYGGATNYGLFSSGLRSVSTGIPRFAGSSTNATYISGTSAQIIMGDGSLSSTLPVASGGTGQSTYTNGQLLIGNTTGNTLTKATLTAGNGVTVTNGTGSITLAADTAVLASKTFAARYATINGSPTFVTQAQGDNSTKVATTAYVDRPLIDNVLSKTADYTIVAGDFVVGKKATLDLYVDATIGNTTITLPSAATFKGYTIYVTKTDVGVNIVTINTVSGLNTLVSQYQERQFNSNGTSWFNH